jgi:molybdenum cofactor cytidylyltransferase
MQFGQVPIENAEGVTLAHSVTAHNPSGGTRVLKKGRVLSSADVQALSEAGVTSITAARLDATDVGEDQAALRIAQALAGPHVTVSAPFTGRCNIYASCDGVMTLDVAAITSLNALDERITVATLSDFERVACGQMLATIKIIPFAVPPETISAAEAHIKHRAQTSHTAALGVARFGARAAALILTELPATKSIVLEKRTRVIADRLAARGATLAHTETTAHTEAATADAIQRAVAQGFDPVLVFAASAIVDRRDVIPAALVLAGGDITRLGMPVDPGNLLLLGAHGATTVIGVPSCAASPKLNGFDWVLDRVLAGLNVTSRDVANMGVGGLLKEIPSRPQPRDVPRTERADEIRRAPRLACIVLAAGRSTRMGHSNKLLEDLRGAPIVHHVVRAAIESVADAVIVVTGHQSAEVKRALSGLDIIAVENRDYASGLASSLRTGLAALPADIDGVFVALGDMPEITAAHLDQLAAAFDPAENRAIVTPMRQGQRGNPVLWARQFFAEMAKTTGDTGAKALFTAHADNVEIDLGSDAVLDDIDTPEALAALRTRDASRVRD